MSKKVSYATVTDIYNRLKDNLERRKSNGELVDYEIEALYDDYKIEVRLTFIKGLPEIVLFFDINNPSDVDSFGINPGVDSF